MEKEKEQKTSGNGGSENGGKENTNTKEAIKLFITKNFFCFNLCFEMYFYFKSIKIYGNFKMKEVMDLK